MVNDLFMRRIIKKNNYMFFILILFFLIGLFVSYTYSRENVSTSAEYYELNDIPEYFGKDYIYINNNEPLFDSKYINTNAFESYSDLDYLGRSGVAFANVGIELMPTEKRGSIGMIKPSGWNQKKYDIVDGKYLYNRCHLIGYQLTGENANEKNLITCTRQTNVGAMLDFENKVADYIKETKNHVLYRATPIFEGNNLLASGIHLEGMSVEDSGEGIKFNVYIYNVQDGIEINYLNGENYLKSNN